MKRLLVLLTLFLISCSGPRVVYDYDTQEDFSKYKTYNYFPELDTGLNDFDQKRLLEATDKAMAEKGFKKADTPQLHINFKGKEYSTPSNNSIGIGIGNGPVQVGGGIPFGKPNQRIQLTVDFIDVQNNKLVWNANIDDTQNSKQTPESRTDFFNIMMSKVLAKYPPEKK